MNKQSQQDVTQENNQQQPTPYPGVGQMRQESNQQIESRQAALSQPFEVGQWLAMPDLNQLEHRSEGLVRHLEPRLMQLLSYLAANPDMVLSRDELVQELWPRVIVNENSLTRAVSELRKQLESTSMNGQHYIQTIPKRGYRLRVPVRLVEMAETEAIQEAAAAEPVAVRPDLLTTWLPQTASRRAPTTLAAACLTLVLGAWLLNSPNVDSESNLTGPLADQLVSNELPPLNGEFKLSAAPDEALPGNVTTPVISPDRQHYAFIAREATGFAVYTGELHSQREPARVYQHSTPLSNLTWSPLGNALLFAQHPTLTPAAIFAGQRDSATLVSLDLETRQVSKLVPEKLTPNAGRPESNLT